MKKYLPTSLPLILICALFFLIYERSTPDSQSKAISKNQHQVILSKDAPAPIGPYSQAILVGNTLYLAGQIAIDSSTGQMAAGGIQDQNRASHEKTFKPF